MKRTDKKPVVAPAVHQPQVTKQSSGDKKFDDAIDRLLKKPPYQAPAK